MLCVSVCVKEGEKERERNIQCVIERKKEEIKRNIESTNRMFA
jgi:hypothetical protein